MKQLIGWTWWMLWWQSYGRWNGWGRSLHYGGPWLPTVIGYAVIRIHGGPGFRWFWRRQIDGKEILGP